jgi:lysophospholipase L1-like esterase
MTSRPPWTRWLAGPLTAVAVLVSCSGGDEPEARPPDRSTSAPPAPEVYVAVGASETVGVGAGDPVREAWPRVLHERAAPSADLLNVGVSGATVGTALQEQLPPALAAEPDLVTVWLAVNDVVALVPVATYERQLGLLVAALRRDGAAEVLVGNVPDLWRLPAYRACVPGSGVTDVPCLLPFVPDPLEVRGLVEEYNAAIERVVAAEGARLVDLSGRGGLNRLTARDGFHPSTAGHRAVAEAFERALTADGP